MSWETLRVSRRKQGNKFKEGTTHIIASISANPSNTCIACTAPRMISRAGTNAGARRRILRRFLFFLLSFSLSCLLSSSASARQRASIIPLTAASHLSTSESMKRPIQAPAMAPALCGTQPANHNVSPRIKCTFRSMVPAASVTLSSVAMSMPLAAPRARGSARSARMRRGSDILVVAV